MTTQPTNKGIINSWSLMAFAVEFGPQMEVAPFVNSDNGDSFKSCVFTKGDEKTFVSFSSNMGELTPREIALQKDSLQVVQLTSGKYNLCRMGANSWEKVDLGL